MTLYDHVKQSERCYLETLLSECDGDTYMAARIADVSEAELQDLWVEHRLGFVMNLESES